MGINRKQWEKMWNEIETSVMNWETPNGWENVKEGKITLTENDKIGELSWLHNYSSNYEGAKINEIGVYYTSPQEVKHDIMFFIPEKKWFKNGVGTKCNITEKQINDLKNSVEKFLIKKNILEM